MHPPRIHADVRAIVVRAKSLISSRKPYCSVILCDAELSVIEIQDS